MHYRVELFQSTFVNPESIITTEIACCARQVSFVVVVTRANK